MFGIAGAGSNHNGELEKAKQLIDEATDAGADAVMFHALCVEDLYVKDSGEVEYLDDDRSVCEITPFLLKRCNRSINRNWTDTVSRM